MQTLRKLFPITQEVVYLNSSAVSPLSLPVKQAIEQCMQARAGHGTDPSERQNQLQGLRRKVADLINAAPDEIAILHSTSDGICTVAGGLDWQEGDNVVINDLENPANVVPWLNLRERIGVEVRKVSSREGRLLPEDLFAATDERTRVISVAFVQWTNGFRTDLQAIGDFCRERGIYLLVDAIQGLGVVEFDVKRFKVDFMTAGAGKWMLGPIGISCFYCRRELLDRLQLAYASYGSVVTPPDLTGVYEYVLVPGAERFEISSKNYLGIYGFNASLGIIERAGVKNIEKHVMRLTDVLIGRLQEKGYQIRSSLDPRERSGIISFAHEKHDSEWLLQRLSDANIVVSLRAGGIRVGVHLFNNEEDIERLIQALPDN
jgi:selenocysteine lyase/cysteine desulfurase